MDKYDAIIIGAGFSGMLCGAELSKKGKKILILEKENFIGGRAAKRKFSEWVWGKSNNSVSYGPHILPSGGAIEKSIKDLGIVKKIKSEKLSLPQFYAYNGFLEFPKNVFNPLSDLKFISEIKRRLSYGEIMGFVRMSLISIIHNEDNLIKKYEKMSCKEFLNRMGIRSKEGRYLASGIIGGYCFNDDINQCPALDLLINLRLFWKGILKSGTIMHHIDYSSFFTELKNIILKNGGKILTNTEIEEILVRKKNYVEGIKLDGEKIFGDSIIFTGTPKQFKKIIKCSGFNGSFLNDYLKESEAEVMDLIVLSKTRIHNKDTGWVSVFDKDYGYVIIDEEPKEKGPYVYHICTIIHKDFMRIDRIKMSLKNSFGFDLEKTLLTKTMRLTGYGTKKKVSIPYSKRSDLKTPYVNLYWIGDSKGLYVGTEGCAQTVAELIKILTL